MGWASIVAGWLVILLAISRNPWFVFTENAFSDLGSASANDPWLFNLGMILTGVMIVLYAVHLLEVSINKASRVGGASMALTGLMLMMIGSFPEGTPYHYTVSIWFFSQGALTVLIWGLALMGETPWRKYGLIFTFMGIVGPIIALIVPWSSTAVAETYGIPPLHRKYCSKLKDLLDLLQEQKDLELSHVQTISESIRGLKHPMVRVVLEFIIHDSMKHAAIAQALIDVEAGAVPMKLDVDLGPAVNLAQSIKQHVIVEQNMLELLEQIDDLVEDDRVQAFIDYLVEEEKRHHKLLKELSSLLDRETVSLDEYVGLFQKYMIVPP